jgi:general secretion pathway protein K
MVSEQNPGQYTHPPVFRAAHRDARHYGRRNPRRGGALLAVLWLSAGLSAIAFSIASTVRAETDRVSSTGDGLRASYLAQGALERGIQWMLWTNTGFFYTNPDGTPKFWARGMPRMTMRFPSGDALVEVIPEAAKLNINTADPDELYRVVLAVSGDPGRARMIADGIVDWRSPAGSPSSFDQYYFGLGPTFRARHASFEEIEELLWVRGMSPELFYGNYTTGPDGRLYARGGLRDCLSVWGSQGPFDVNTASPALMEALGTPADTVAAIVTRRQIQPFATLAEVRELAPDATRLGVGGGFSIFTLRAAARLRNGDGSYSDVVRASAATVKFFDIRRSLTPMQILRWYDDAWSQTLVAPYPGMPIQPGNTGPVAATGVAQ